MGLLSILGLGKGPKETPEEAPKLDVHKSRWGYHPVSHADFLILKAIHKRYWETLKRAYAWQRWTNKTVYQTGPEPEVDRLFIDPCKYSHFTTTMNSGDTRWHTLNFTRKIQQIVDDFQTARMPVEKPKDVQPLRRDMESYRDIYEKMVNTQST